MFDSQSYNIVAAACLLCDIYVLQVWDDKIIESAVKTFYGSDLTVMIQSIQKNIAVCFRPACLIFGYLPLSFGLSDIYFSVECLGQ